MITFDYTGSCVTPTSKCNWWAGALQRYPLHLMGLAACTYWRQKVNYGSSIEIYTTNKTRLKSSQNVSSSQIVYALPKGKSRSQTNCTHVLSQPPPAGKAIRMNFLSGLGIAISSFQPGIFSTSSNSGSFRWEILDQSSGRKKEKKKYFKLKDSSVSSSAWSS